VAASLENAGESLEDEVRSVLRELVWVWVTLNALATKHEDAIRRLVNVKRFLTLSAFGFLYHGPSGHYFYNWLDKQIEGTTGKVVALKVMIDQLIWCPLFMTVFFTYLGLVNGDSLATIGAKIKNDLFTAVQGSWKVWPFVHTINFRFISTKHRLVFINGVQIAFNMFLSILGSK